MKNLKIAVLVSTILLYSCTRESNFEEIKDPSQVAARVGDQEITVHQVQQLVNAQLKQTTSRENLPNIALDQLIKQELLLQQAQKMKLDRDPDALLAIEAAKKKIIVDTYLKKVFESSSTETVTQNDIRAYFDDNPQYFRDRKKFIYTQLAIEVPEENRKKVIQLIESSQTIDSLKVKIENEGLRFKRNQLIQTTEKMPKVLVDPLYSLNEEDLGYLTMPDGLLVLDIEETEALPLSFDEASPAIESYLYNEKRKEDVEQLVSNLEEAAQIEYVGDFKPID